MDGRSFGCLQMMSSWLRLNSQLNLSSVSRDLQWGHDPLTLSWTNPSHLQNTHTNWKPSRCSGVTIRAHLHSAEQDVGHTTPQTNRIHHWPLTRWPPPWPQVSPHPTDELAGAFPRGGALFGRKAAVHMDKDVCFFVVAEQVEEVLRKWV